MFFNIFIYIYDCLVIILMFRNSKHMKSNMKKVNGTEINCTNWTVTQHYIYVIFVFVFKWNLWMSIDLDFIFNLCRGCTIPWPANQNKWSKRKHKCRVECINCWNLIGMVLEILTYFEWVQTQFNWISICRYFLMIN